MNHEIGKKYNKWTILEEAGRDKWNNQLYKCKCECGRKSARLIQGWSIEKALTTKVKNY